MEINTPDYYEIDVDNSIAFLFEHKLYQRNIKFRSRDRTAGAFAESFITFYVGQKDREIVNKIVAEIYDNAESPKKKIRHFFKLVEIGTSVFVTLIFIVLNYLFINFAINSESIFGGVWISVVVVFVLSVLAVSVILLKHKN